MFYFSSSFIKRNKILAWANSHLKISHKFSKQIAESIKVVCDTGDIQIALLSKQAVVSV